MKKRAVILAVLLAVLTASAALAEDVAGDWYLHLYGLNEGSAVCFSAFSELGLKWDLTLREDGGGHAVVNLPTLGVKADDPLTWTREGDKLTIVVRGAAQEYTLADGKLTTMIDETKLVWLRGELPPEYVEGVPFVTGLSAVDFDGSWQCVRVTLEEESLMPVEITDMEARFELENGAGWLVLTRESGQEVGVELTGQLAETEDGTVLTVRPLDENATPSTRFMLREDGVLVGFDDVDGATYTYYCRKVEAE